MRDLAVQGAQMLLVLVLAPLLLGFTRKVKARMLRRRGPPVLQPYRDDPVCAAVERAVHAGILVVTAAGNGSATITATIDNVSSSVGVTVKGARPVCWLLLSKATTV